jgi:hypothetical protein
MTLNASGPISLGGSTAGQSVNLELGAASNATISFNDAAVRTLTGTTAGTQLTMPGGFYGKSIAFTFNATISANTNDYNLRSAAVAAGWNTADILNATITINAGVIVGSSSTATPAFTTGTPFPAGTTLALINNGVIYGRGGNGGAGGGSGGGGGAGVANSTGGARGSGNSSPANAGQPGGNTTAGSGGAQGSAAPTSPAGNAGSPGGAGGLALQVQAALTLTNNGTIGGGGGGGGGGGISFNNFPPQPGSFITINHAGGTGGGLGAVGAAGTTGNGSAAGSGGAAGDAITGNSNITYLATGTRLGSIT